MSSICQVDWKFGEVMTVSKPETLVCDDSISIQNDRYVDWIDTKRTVLNADIEHHRYAVWRDIGLRCGAPGQEYQG